jgi:hypothetical protein
MSLNDASMKTLELIVIATECKDVAFTRYPLFDLMGKRGKL